MKKILLIKSLLYFVCICDAQIFTPLGNGISASLNTLYYDSLEQKLYVGGNFYTVNGNLAINKIAVWDGISWDSLGSGVNDGGLVFSITKYNGEIYAGGSFSMIGGILSKGLAKWDGTTWLPVANFTYGTVNSGWVQSLKVINNELYVLGAYDSLNNQAAGGIVKFDGSNWFIFPTIDNCPQCYIMGTICEYNGILYVGGNFDGGPGIKDIAKFDGSNWVSVGGGLSGGATFVEDLDVFNGELYVGGFFNVASGDPGNNIAKWDGTSWSQLGSGTSPGQVRAMAEYNGELYVGGAFNNAGGVNTSWVAKWDGSAWDSIGGAFNNQVLRFSENSPDLYMGGGFTDISGININRVVKYNLLTGIESIPVNSKALEIWYDASSQSIKVKTLHEMNFEIKSCQILDIYGRKINSDLKKSSYIDGIYSIPVSPPNGLYIVQILSKGKSFTQKLPIFSKER